MRAIHKFSTKRNFQLHARLILARIKRQSERKTGFQSVLPTQQHHGHRNTHKHTKARTHHGRAPILTKLHTKSNQTHPQSLPASKNAPKPSKLGCRIPKLGCGIELASSIFRHKSQKEWQTHPRGADNALSGA
jgi:hypothetical protein